MKSFTSDVFWSAVGCKLVEQLISVKLWVITLASIFAFKLLNIVTSIKNTTLALVLSDERITNDVVISSLVEWSKGILDIALAFFTAVVVVVLLSREVFKHSILPIAKKDETKKIQSRIV